MAVLFVTAIAFKNAKVSVGMLGKLSHNVTVLGAVRAKNAPIFD